MVKKLKYDRRKVSQELESYFLGSGDNVIPVDTIEKIKVEDIRDPEDNVCRKSNVDMGKTNRRSSLYFRL